MPGLSRAGKLDRRLLKVREVTRRNVREAPKVWRWGDKGRWVGVPAPDLGRGEGGG